MRGTARGLTLVEMLVALAVTAVVGLAVTSMLTAVAHGSDHTRDLRRVNVEAKAINERITQAVRRSQQVLAHGENHLVLWRATGADTDAPTLHQLQRIEYDADEQQLVSYRAAESAPDIQYDNDDDFAAITGALMGSPVFPGATWGRSVVAWSSALDADAARDARLVSQRLTLRAGRFEEIVISAAALRNEPAAGGN